MIQKSRHEHLDALAKLGRQLLVPRVRLQHLDAPVVDIPGRVQTTEVYGTVLLYIIYYTNTTERLRWSFHVESELRKMVDIAAMSAE